MINIKADLIRFGTSRFWSNKSSNFDFKPYITNIALTSLVKDFFCAEEFRTSAFTFDSAVLHSYSTFFNIDIFIQDSILEELVFYIRPRIKRFRKNKRVNKDLKLEQKKFDKIKLFQSPSFTNFSLFRLRKKKRFTQKIKRKFRTKSFAVKFNAEFINTFNLNYFIYKRAIANITQKIDSSIFQKNFSNFRIFFDFQYLNPFSIIYPIKKNTSRFFTRDYKKNFSTIHPRQTSFKSYHFFGKPFVFTTKLKTRISTFSYIPKIHFYPILNYHFFSSKHSPRYLLFAFFSKLFSKFSDPFFPIYRLSIFPVYYINTNVNAYAFYSIVRLKYKYILSHVIRPIIKGIARYYKGFFILCNGRFTRAQMASTKIFSKGVTKFNTIRIPIFYKMRTIPLRYGASTIHLWLTHLHFFKKMYGIHN